MRSPGSSSSQGTPFARVLSSAQTEVSLERVEQRHERDDRAAPEAERLLPALRRLHGPPRGRGDARRGARRAGADQWLTATAAPQHALVGLGRPRTPARAAGACARVPRRGGRRPLAPAPAGRARAGSPRCAAPDRGDAASDCARSSAPSTCATITPSACCTPPARAIRTSCACARASPRARRTPSCYPATHAQLAGSSSRCARASRSPSCPFGGGTSVVGGVEPLRGAHAAVISLDTGRHGRRDRARRESRTVTVAAGLRAPALERHLGAARADARALPAVLRVRLARRLRGDALGRSGIERLRRDRANGARAAAGAPAGELALPAMPASAAGPSLRQLLVGSEGTLGVISELSLRVRAAPRERIYEGVFFEDFAAGVEALRALAQQGASPDVARLSDEARDAHVAGARRQRRSEGPARARVPRRARLPRGLHRDLRLRGRGSGRAARAASGRCAIARAGGGLAVGRSPGEAWRAGRFAAPYLRDELLTHGVMVETLETATQWSNLPPPARGRRRARSRRRCARAARPGS